VSKKINTVSIGLFIVVGLSLGVISLLLFSSSKLFSHTRDIIMYFDESLNGLSEGAPVKYRGVTIGSVKRVMVRFNQASNDYAMPVILEMQPKLLEQRLEEPSDAFSAAALEGRIRRGLRGSLQSESLITGVLYVDIRPRPHAPPPVFHQIKLVYPELPTEPTQIQQLFNNLATLDIKGIETNLNLLLDKLDVTIGGLQMAEISHGLTNLLLSLNQLVTSPEITNDLVAVKTTLDQYQQLGEKLNNRVDPLVDSLTNSLAEANHTLRQFRGAAENLKSMLGPDSPLSNNLDQALEQLSSAAQSISALAEFLKQHPNALIAGRRTPKE
jgi:paraquat-inducible protein B